MENSQLSFQHILNATLRMLRTTWKAKVCLFFQMDDTGALRVRACDGLAGSQAANLSVKPDVAPIATCIQKNKVVEVPSADALGPLAKSLKLVTRTNEKYILAPVLGETRVLGMLLLGPFPSNEKIHGREAELRSAGALCAVLSAHWRLYDWMAGFIPQINHELRTPLTAVQGSIGMVLGGMFGQVGSDVKEMLEMAQKGCERTVRAIEDYIKTQNPTKK